MTLSENTIERIMEAIRSCLEEDLVSYAEFLQTIRGLLNMDLDRNDTKEILGIVLRRGVEIGSAVALDTDYVKFVGWGGGVDERLNRAMAELSKHSEDDQGFAFWLCSHENVDEFEAKAES